MPECTCGDYVYLKDNYEISKNHHKNFIMKQEPDFNITSQMRFMEKKLKMLPGIFVKNMIVPWIEENVQFFAQLSRIDVRNKNGQKNDHMCIGRDDDRNVSSYVDFSRLCTVMLGFPELSTYFSTNGITFLLL